MRGRRPIYVMAKPAGDLRDLLWGLPRVQAARGAQLLHVTLLALLDLAVGPPGAVAQIVAAMAAFRGRAFRIVFDRVRERGCVTLCGSEPMRGVEGFQAALGRHFSAHGVPVAATPTPHLTLRYGCDGRGDAAIDPISWRVEEVRLVESVVGEGRHVEHGCWRLAA